MKIIGGFLFLCFLVYACQRLNSGTQAYSRQPIIPVLKGNEINPVLLIKINTGKTATFSVKSFEINFTGTDDPGDIDSVSIYVLGKDSILAKGARPVHFGQPVPISEKLIIPGKTDSLPSACFFMVSVKLKGNASLHHRVGCRCTRIEFDNNSYSVPVPSPTLPGQRIGVAVRKHNDDNVDTYRIPGLTTTRKGTLLSIYDVRRESSRDLQGHIDIGVSRSTDGGNSWEPMRIGLDRGEWGGLPEKFNGVSDACILADENSNKIFLAGLWMHGVINDNGKWVEGLTNDSTNWNHQWRNKGSQPGFDIKQTSQFLIATSTDDGKTWGEPVNLTRMCKKVEWWLWAPAPGHGISLKDGTLVFPTQGRDKNGETFSNITYSKDGGLTWTASNPAFSNTTENMVVRLSDGSIMLNARFNLNRNNQTDTNGRVVVTTRDLGKTWEEHSSSRSALLESTCMASLHKHIYRENGEEKSILLFSNPNTKTGRHHMTLKVSFDDGKSWPEKYWLLLDEGNSRGYSCLTSIDENTIGILYEGSRSDMTFESIPLKEILKSEE